MKRFTKVLISMLLLVSMLAGYIPALDFTTTANAATEPAYKYVKVDSVTPGKTYLIASGPSGTPTLVGVGDGTAEGGGLTYTTATVSSGEITSLDNADNFEWSIVPGRDASNNLKATYMLQNVATGAYLYNPVYDIGGSNSPQSMAITYNPLKDDYSPYTRQSFSLYNPAQDKGVSIGADTASNASYATKTPSNDWLTLKGAAGKGTNFNIQWGGLSGSTYKYGGTVLYQPTGAPSTTLSTFAFYMMFTGAGNGGFAGHEGLNYTTTVGSNSWNTIQMPRCINASKDDGGIFGGDMYSASSVYTRLSGKLNYFRIDMDTDKAQLYMAYSYLAKSDHAHVALLHYLRQQARRGGSGAYPSQRFPFCQYCIGSGSNGMTVGNFALETNLDFYIEMYFYGWNNGEFVRYWNNNLANTYFYEKRPVGEENCVWTLVENEDEIKSGEEYIICTTDSDSTGNILLSNSTSGIGYHTNITVSNKIISDTVSDNDIWYLRFVGSDRFYIQSKSTGHIITTDDNGTHNVERLMQGIDGKEYTYRRRYVWNYDFTNHNLIAHTVTTWDKVYQETEYTTTIGLSSTAVGDGTCYLYKKTYHTHNWDAGVETTAATCTSTGVRTYTCGVTSNVWTFPVGNSYNPIAVGNQGDNFDVEMDIKLIDGKNTNGDYAGLKTGWSDLATAPLFTQDGVGVGTEKISGTYNVGQWYHVKWDVSDNGTTTIYVDDVNVGTVNAKPTLNTDDYTAFWQWDRISIDNLKIGNYFCDMENGGIGGQGQLISDTMVEGCGATWTETIPALGHRWNDGVTTKEPTCTENGVKTYTCDGTNMVFAFLDTHYYNPVIVGNQGTNFDVEVDIKINASGGGIRNERYGGYAKAPVFTQNALGVGSITRPGSFNIGQWYHVKWDASDDGSTAIYVDDVYYGTVAATPTLYDGNQAFWEWNNIYIDNLKVGTYSCDMENGLEGTNSALGYSDMVKVDAGCGTTKTEAIPATGHDYTTAGVTPPTCTAQGYTTYTCSKCGYSYNDNYTDALGHDFTSTVYRYNGDGTHSVKCTRCDVYGDAVACTLGSYTSNGSGENDTHSATCSVCNGTFSAVHTWEETARTGDCGTDGYVDYRCTVCGQTRRETVTASGEHSAPDDWTIVTEATCESDGLREKRCTVCGKILESEAIPATGHNYVDTVTEATCTEQGYTTHVCANCNDTYVDNYVDALGHDWGEWTVVTYPTISAPGEEKRVCRRCGEEETAVIPQLTQTTLTASNENTTPGGTATVTFTLKDNPGIWAQNFVIYFPKALTVESVTASTAVYSDYDMGETSTGIIPTSNPRMLEYFNAAGIPDSSKYKAIAYYTDNGNEDSHADGLIVSVTFRVPEAGKCLKRYDVNLFGVFADNDGDAVNWSGESPAITYVNGGINIEGGIAACEKHEYGEWTVTTAPTCTSKGTQERICSVCGYIDVAEIDMLPHTWVEATCTEAGYCSVCGTVNPDAPALGHLWGDWITVREASGISPEIQKRHCGRCSAFETREYGSAIGTGYSEYAGDELTYKYYLTDTVTPGHEYVIVNSNTAGAAKSLTDINTAISSQNITVENDGTGLFVSPSADSYIWNTTGTEEGVLFANKSSGKFLKAYGETDTPDISLNVTSSDNPFGSSAFMYNSNGYSAKSGYYLGYKSDITVQESTGGTGAAPSGDIMVMEAYTYMKYYNNGALFKLNTPFSIEFDFAFNSEDSVVCIKNSVFDNILNISNSTKQIYICGDSSNTTPIDASAYLLGGTGYTLWNHCKYEVANGYVTVTLNGHQFDSVSYGSFSFVPKDNNGNDKPGFIMGTYTVDNGGGGNTAYDNFTITLNGEVLGTITDGKTHNDGYMSGGMGADSTDGFSNATLPSNWSNGGTTTTKTYATNVFTASNDSSDKVYFYEKRPVGDVIEVYELVDDITAGETYVLVDANEAGSAKLLASDATASSATVYSDGISYTPYVLATADQEYTVVKAGNGYIFNSANNNFLSPTGITGSLTADNVLECKNGAVTVKGNTYYLYKKTQITKIDTGLASDFAVVDFGTGITVGADDVRAFRNNDTYSDRVDVSLSALVTDDDGLIKNNKFYKYNLASDKLAAANGEGVYVLDKSGVGTLSLTLGEGATLRFVPTSANYETVQTFTYQCTVDRIGAYMYADLKVIPATTIYYEDNREGFITYTNGTYPDEANGAKWEIVDSNSAINTLLGDEKVYGYSDDYTSYLKYSGNSAHKITVTSSQITSGTGWMPTATFTFTGTGFDLISATSGATTLVTLEITNTVTGETKKIAVNSYFGYQYIPADNETGTPASWEPVAKDDTVAMYQVPIVRWRGNYGNYSVKVIPTYNKIMDVAKLGYSDFYLDAVRVYNPVDVSDAANADVKSQYQADKELVSYEANLRRLLIPKDSVIPGESSSVSGVVFTDGNGLTRTVNTYTDYTNPIANNEIIVPAGTGVSFALNAADGTVPERILLGAKVSAGVGTDESVELVVSGGGEPKTIRLGTSTDMYYDITDAIKWNGTTTETITIYNRGIEGKDPHISLTNIKFTSGSETASLSSLNFFVSAAMEADTYKVLAEEFGVELVYGDIDGDGTVNTVDSKLIKKQMLGLIELAGYDYEAGDIDGDGEISSKDVKLLMKMLLTD